MGEPKRYQYTIDLARIGTTGSTHDLALRSITRDDHQALSTLMLDAYIETIDYEGEGVEEAREEVESFLDDRPLLNHSFAVVENEHLLSACLLTTWTDGNPFIGYVMTDPDHKNRGLAKACLLESLSSLTAAGEATVNLFITEGNKPSEQLFTSIGAHRVPIDN